MDLLTSIKGIGVTLAAALIVATGGFTYFDNAKLLQKSEMRKDIVIELSYKGFG